MPAKLDTSKPLRLIGIQIYEGTHENVRKIAMKWESVRLCILLLLMMVARKTITG